MTDRTELIDIVFDGPPSHESGRFVEVESPPGTSIKFGEWVQRDEGYWALRFTMHSDQAEIAGLKNLLNESDKLVDWCNDSGKALSEMMKAYERRVRTDCTQEDLAKEPWRCHEFIVAESALKAKPVWYVSTDVTSGQAEIALRRDQEHIAALSAAYTHALQTARGDQAEIERLKATIACLQVALDAASRWNTTE